MVSHKSADKKHGKTKTVKHKNGGSVAADSEPQATSDILPVSVSVVPSPLATLLPPHSIKKFATFEPKNGS
ncbi:MAG: hypothetical protein LBT53_08430 [Puniceicoccales bacterium]|nr:hypothetical protein [Puniceicoccales bacterium]